jgi:hypothetical protein
MTRSARFVYRSLCSGAVMLAASGLAIPPAQAKPLPANAKNSVVLCTCDPSNVNFTDSNAVGNIWIGSEDGGGFSGSGSGTITGSVDFAQPNIGQYSPDGIAVTGGAIYNNANVAADLDAVIMASQTFSTEPGTTLDIIGGDSVNASSGMMDSAGNEVFTAAIDPEVGFAAGTTFTIDGTSNQSVVINIPSTGGQEFDGSVVLTGGITADEVLFNFDSGNYDTGTGGDTLIMDSVDPNPITTGTFLDPNGAIEITDFDIYGRLFGGDSLGIQITGSDLYDPVPEPTSLVLLGAGLAGLGAIRRRRRRPFLRS